MLVVAFLQERPPPPWGMAAGLALGLWAGWAGTNTCDTLVIHLAEKNTPTMWP